MKTVFISFFVFILACSQESKKNYGEELDQLFQEIRAEIGKNANNLTKQLDAGITGIKSLENFVEKNKIDNYEALNRWLEVYFATTQYVYKKVDSRNDFLKTLINSSSINVKFKRKFKTAVNEFIERDQIQREMKEKFEIGNKFPSLPKKTKDVNGKSVSLDDYKGKIVLVDFWATWCGPCIRELPNVKSVYSKYKSKGFDIIGISFDGPNRDKFMTFIRNKSMSWHHIYDGGHWKSKLATYYNIKSIPATFLLKDGKIIAKDLRGKQLMQKVASLLD